MLSSSGTLVKSYTTANTAYSTQFNNDAEISAGNRLDQPCHHPA
jgi:hypothetical protein